MRTSAPRQRLVGREAQTVELDEVLARVASGRFAAALLEGEPGIGKTRLLEHTLDRAQQLGMYVVAGTAQELERNRPFGLLTAAFGCTPSAPDPRRAAIARMVATADNGGGQPITVTSDPGLLYRVVDAFRDLVEGLALASPVVIGVDDLQWADPSSLLTLGVLSASLGSPIGLIGCFRPVPRSVDLERISQALHQAGARRLSLGPLAEPAVRDLVAQLARIDPGPRLLDEVAGTAGNPLYISELVGALTQEGALHLDHGRADLEQRSLPPTLRLTILRRLSFLSEPTLLALRSASVLGSAFSLTDLATVTGQSALDLSQSLAEALVAQVLSDDGDCLRFRHDLVRDAVYADLPPTVVRALHREAGQRLAAAGAPALQVAEHLARGATIGDTEAIDWLARAAREAASRSPAVAATLLGRAIDLSGPAQRQREHLIVERASALMWSGQVADAAQTCRDVLDHVHDRRVELAARTCLGQALLAAGHPRAALDELQQAAQGSKLTASERATVFGWQGLCQVWLADLDAATDAAAQAWTAAEDAADHLPQAIATTILSVAARLRGQLEQALLISDEAVREADRSAERRGHRYPVNAPHAYALIELDRLEDARSSVEAGTRISEELGTAWHLANYLMIRALEHFTAGDWDDAVADVSASRELAGETGEAYGVVVGLSLLCRIQLHRNDLSGARETSRTIQRQTAASEDRYGVQQAALAQALVLDADGLEDEAFTRLANAWDECHRLGLEMEYRALGPDLVRLALRTGHRSRALDVTVAVESLAARNDVASLSAVALRCRGLLSDDAEALDRAAQLYAIGPRLLSYALTCEAAGMAFVRQGDVARGRTRLLQGLGVYDRLEAARDIARLESTLRAVGVRRGRRRTRPPERRGWDSLTPAEHTVARLVAEGLSNPQIGGRLYVSSRTVQTHLAHIFDKLDISSRTQLAVQVSSHSG